MKTLLITFCITIAFFKYEISEGYGSKVCVYESYRGLHSVTMKGYAYCPYSIEVQ